MKTKAIRITLIVSLLCSALLTFGINVVPAQAATVLSNLSGPWTGGTGINAIYTLASGFTVPAGPDYILNGATFLIYNSRSISHTVSAWLYSDSGGTPGTNMGSLGSVSVPPNGILGLPYSISGGSMLLKGGQTYWIVANSDYSSIGGVYWILSSVAPSGVFTYAGQKQNQNGAGWASYSSGFAQITVDASIATAESAPPPPPIKRCTDYNFDNDNGLRADVPNKFMDQIYCRVLFIDGRPNRWLGSDLYTFGHVGNRRLVDMGIIGAVDVQSPTGLRQFNDAVVCLRGAGKMYILPDTFSTAPREPFETTAWTVEVFKGYTCATLYSPAILVLVKGTEGSSAQAPVEVKPLEGCTVELNFSARLRAEPSEKSTILATLPFKGQYAATGYAPGWYRIHAASQIGFISESLVTASGTCK